MTATTATSLACKRKLEVVFFSTFDTSAMTTTFLASKHEPEVVFFSIFNVAAMTTTSLAPKRELEVVFFFFFFRFSMRLPRPPPPSHPNARQRWFFCLFRQTRHHHHLPCIQTRDRGGPFNGFNWTATTTTSLVSKHKTEVVLSAVSTRLPPLPPPSHPNASWRWFFHLFQQTCNHHHLPCIQTQDRGGSFICFDGPATTTTSHPHYPLPPLPCHYCP